MRWMRSWFEELVGFEEIYSAVRDQLVVDGQFLRSNVNGSRHRYGQLETPMLDELRSQSKPLIVDIKDSSRGISINEVVADVQDLHCDPRNQNAMFQVASQFNLLEMVSPSVTPEAGVTIYQSDFTQGPACAIACGAGTIYRNYFANVDGHFGQTSAYQIDCLKDLGIELGNTRNELWSMENGYAIPRSGGLENINSKLMKSSDSKGDSGDSCYIDALRGKLRIGVMSRTAVTLNGCEHVVSQAYCSALPVAYSGFDSAEWMRFATLVLEAAYEATFHAAILNLAETGNNQLFLTLLGGGAFGNETSWIINAISRCVRLFRETPLDVKIVSYGRSSPSIRELVDRI